MDARLEALGSDLCLRQPSTTVPSHVQLEQLGLVDEFPPLELVLKVFGRSAESNLPGSPTTNRKPSPTTYHLPPTWLTSLQPPTTNRKPSPTNN